MTTALLALVLCCVAVSAGEAVGAKRRDPFPTTIPEAFGINSHFWDFSKDGKRGANATFSMDGWQAWWGKIDPLEGMAKSGFTLHRFMVDWANMEEVKGQYAWGLQDALMKECERVGMRPLLLIAYGNPVHDATSGPSPTCGVHAVLTKEGRDGFAAWARQVARRYKGRGCLYELWNEPNITIFWPKPDPDAYVALVEAAAPAIRAEDPAALILGGAMSPKDMADQFDLSFITRCVEKGLLKHVDAISWHPYNLARPELARDQIATLRALVDKHAPAGRRIELIVSEVGYDVTGDEADSLRFHGSFLPRMLLSNLSLGVPTVWYEVMPNCGRFSLIERPRDGNTGQYLFPKRIAWGFKPGVAAVRVLSEALRGFSVAKRLEFGDPQTDFVLELQNGKRRALAAWTTVEAGHDLALRLPAGKGTLVSYEAVRGDEAEQLRLMGKDEAGVRTPIAWKADGLRLPVNGWPKYLLIGETPAKGR